jgi:hypothetical protein
MTGSGTESEWDGESESGSDLEDGYFSDLEEDDSNELRETYPEAGVTVADTANDANNLTIEGN